MNLVKSTLDQVSGDVLGKLSSLSNADRAATQTAVETAVPTILAGLLGTAANKDGLKRLTSKLGGLDLGSLTNVSQLLGGEAAGWLQKGTSLLTSLLGENLVENIAAAIGRYSGIGGDSARRIIAGIAPLVLGQVGSKWKSAGGNAEALESLLTDQKEHITQSLPYGFSLANVPGMAAATNVLESADRTVRMVQDRATEAARGGAATARSTANSWQWMVPLAAVLVLGLGLWYWLSRREDIAQRPDEPAPGANENQREVRTALRPDTSAVLDPANTAVVTDQLRNVFTQAIGDLEKVGDAASVETARTQLTALNTKIDAIRGILDKMPEAGQAAVGALVSERMEALKQAADKALAAPGGEQLSATITQIRSKLAGLNLAGVSKEVTTLMNDLTKALQGITDRSTAQEVVPHLEQTSEKIDNLRAVRDSMSAGGQTMLAKLVSGLLPPLEQLVTKVLTSLGADASGVRPVLNGILEKLTALTAPPSPT